MVVNSGRPVANKSTVALPLQDFEAGNSPAFILHLVDQYNNHVSLSMLALGNDISLQVALPENQTTITYKVGMHRAVGWCVVQGIPCLTSALLCVTESHHR